MHRGGHGEFGVQSSTPLILNTYVCTHMHTQTHVRIRCKATNAKFNKQSITQSKAKRKQSKTKQKKKARVMETYVLVCDAHESEAPHRNGLRVGLRAVECGRQRLWPARRRALQGVRLGTIPKTSKPPAPCNARSKKGHTHTHTHTIERKGQMER